MSKIIGRLMPWLEVVGIATFKLFDVPEPGWWAMGLIVIGTLIQLGIGIWGPKT